MRRRRRRRRKREKGMVVNMVTSVTEFNGDLFLGSLATNFIGKLSLAKVTREQEDAVPS